MFESIRNILKGEDNMKRCLNCNNELTLIEEKTFYDEGMRGQNGIIYKYLCNNCDAYIEVYIKDKEEYDD